MSATLDYAARQAWIGFWHGCMAGAGRQSALAWDETAVASALNFRPRPAPPPPSPLALALEGDGRISDITLADVLTGLDDYFKIFRQMKKVNPDAYDYFSRVGAPLCLDHTKIHSRVFAQGLDPVVNAQDLPAYLGLFMAKSPEEARDNLINDRPTFMDFQLYERRRKNIAVVNPERFVIYDAQLYSLDRNIMTRGERRRFPACGTWGFHYFIGIAEDGRVQALPMKWTTHQRLRDGEVIHHPGFMVPPGLREIAGKGRTVDDYVAMLFTVLRAFAASALTGVQLSIRRGGEVARFGIPLSAAKSFFRDRESNGKRRSPLLHFIGGFERRLANGRVVTVGEHLRGTRHFRWRDHTITLSAPGIHHPSPEALISERVHEDDIEAMPDDAISSRAAANIVAEAIERAPDVPFRKGLPTRRFRTHALLQE